MSTANPPPKKAAVADGGAVVWTSHLIGETQLRP